MLSLTKVNESDLDRSLLERLFSEAFSYISQERQRMGENILKSALIDDFRDLPIIEYRINGYTVGVCSYCEYQYDGKKYLFHRHPIYGKDESGSKSWWYSEDFQRLNSEFVRREGFEGVITLFNPNSPAGRAVGNHFGSFNKYYERPVVYEPSDLGLSLTNDAQGILKAYLINLKD